MSGSVVGREEELVAVEAFLGRIEQGPCALVLAGEAGIGKTVLWETGVAEAHERGVRVLVGRGTEAEASLSFSGLSELLLPVFGETADALVAPRRRALEVALLLAEPGEIAPDSHAVGLAVLDALSALGRQGPVLVAVDDAQWLDPASSGALQVALRRLNIELVGMLATVRVAQESPPFPLEPSFTADQVERLWLGPLSLGALHLLLRERLGLDLTRPELVRVQEATAGNPFFALELGRELVRTGTRPTPGQVLHVPRSLRELLGGRLARLPGETLDVLLETASLARPTVEVVAAAHGNDDRVRSALELAGREGVVELDDSRIRFAHPLLASICYEEAPVWKRRAVHLALANAVEDVEERARHLALAADHPDAGVAAELEAAAEQAAVRGATAAAAELSELAADLTPDAALARSRRVKAASLHRLAAGVGGRAIPILEQLLAEVPSGAERADVLFELAYTRGGDSRTGTELCTQALAELADDDVRCARILCHRSLMRTLSGDVPGARDDAGRALELAERDGDLNLIAVAIARIGVLETWTSDPTPGLLERGAAIEEQLDRQLEFHESPRVALARRRLRQGELDSARGLLDELETEAAARGDEDTRVMILGFDLVPLEWLAGRWQLALEHAFTAHDLAEQILDLHGRSLIARNKALVEVDLGLVEQARASVDEGLALAEAGANEWFAVRNLGVLGRVELAAGNLEAAAGILRELPNRMIALGLPDPGSSIFPDAIETLVAVGELEQAREYLGPFETSARDLGSRWGRVGVERCRALLAAADRNLDASFEAFERSLADTAGFPLERARTLLCLGKIRRQAQQKKAAREALEEAAALFTELGAPLWGERTQAEVRRISGRTPSSEELTETEHRVAELAAQGRTNKEIAAELHMGVSTVESHLSHVYRKLGVRRAGLAARLEEAQGTRAKAGVEPAQT